MLTLVSRSRGARVGLKGIAFSLSLSPEVRIYNRKQEGKKTSEQELDQEIDQEKKQAFSFFLGRVLVFLIAFLVVFLFS